MGKKDTRKRSDSTVAPNRVMDFELHFFESILKRKPDFIEALIAIGNLYTKRGFFQKGLEIDLKLAQLRPDDPMILYNLACSYSLLNHIDEALSTIKLAVEKGYDDIAYLEWDGDLNNLRQDNRFRQILSIIKNKKTSKVNS